MPGMSWSALLNSNTGAGSAYANSTTLTEVSATPPFVMQANFPYSVGTAFTIKAFGVLSTTGTPTMILGAYYGGVAGVALGANAAFTLGSGVTNVPWRFELDVIIRTNGSTGTAMSSGTARFGTSVSAYATAAPVPGTALATVTVDTTAAKAICIGATWSAASASNTLTCHGFKIWSDNM